METLLRLTRVSTAMRDRLPTPALTLLTSLLVVALPRGAQAQRVSSTEGDLHLTARDVEQPSCGGCSYASGIHILSYRVAVSAHAPWEVTRVETTSGVMQGLAISPDGTQAHGVLRASGRAGRGLVTAHLLQPRTGEATTRSIDFEDYDGREVLMCVPSPCSTPGPDELRVPAGPPVREHVVLSRDVALDGLQREGEWPFVLTGSLVSRRPTDPAPSSATMRCTASEATVRGENGTVRVRVDPRAAEGERMRGGRQRCDVTIVVGDGSGARERRGRLDFVVEPDGSVRITSRVTRIAEPLSRSRRTPAQPLEP